MHLQKRKIFVIVVVYFGPEIALAWIRISPTHPHIIHFGLAKNQSNGPINVITCHSNDHLYIPHIRSQRNHHSVWISSRVRRNISTPKITRQLLLFPLYINSRVHTCLPPMESYRYIRTLRGRGQTGQNSPKVNLVITVLTRLHTNSIHTHFSIV